MRFRLLGLILWREGERGAKLVYGWIRFEGFLQIYQLQTENDEEETWRDLVSVYFIFSTKFTSNERQSAHGFDRNLNLVSTRREAERSDSSAGICEHLPSSPFFVPY